MKNIGKFIFGLITLSTIVTYFNIFTIIDFNLIKIVVLLIMLYHLLFFDMMYDNIFVKMPDYWSKSRKENQKLLKNQKKKYSIKEKIKLTTYFVLYVLMLFVISVYIIFNINIITIFSGVGVLLFLIDTSILFYKLI